MILSSVPLNGLAPLTTDDADVSDEGILELANASVLVDVAFPISLGSAALLLLLKFHWSVET